MTNGFYNMDNFKDKAYKRKWLSAFINKAMSLSYRVSCQRIVGWQRQECKDLSVSMLIANAILDKTSTLHVIDRYESRQHQIPKEHSEYEVTLTCGIGDFLYIFINEDNFKKLIEQYGLTLKEF